MPQRPRRCKRCHASGDEHLISYRGLCPECSEAAMTANWNGLRDRTTPEYARWWMGCLAAIERGASAAPRDDTQD